MMRFALVLTGLLCLAACTPTAPTAYPPAETGRPGQASHGVIVSRRAIDTEAAPTAAAHAGSKDVRASILGAVGNLPGGPAGNAGGPASARPAVFEFIIRQDNGQTISVVQTDEAGLRPGERVVVSMGTRTRLLRASD